MVLEGASALFDGMDGHFMWREFAAKPRSGVQNMGYGL